MDAVPQSSARFEELADYRGRVAGLYARARRTELRSEVRWDEFRRKRDCLFAAHPQSALFSPRAALCPASAAHADTRILKVPIQTGELRFADWERLAVDQRQVDRV